METIKKSISQRIIDGDLKSPYIPAGENEYPAEDAIYVDMRITGTGKTLRNKKFNGQEVVDKNGNIIQDVYYRPPEEFLTPEFVQACNGLPVTIQHPDDNFHMGNIDFFIGTIIHPYIKGTEVWGVARIYDGRFFEAIHKGISSTSPSVISDDVLQEDGSYKEVFKSINHVALVPVGHWDVVAVRPAIRMDENKIQIGASNMADNDKKAQEPKNDADIVDRVAELEKKMADIISAEKREGHPELKGDSKKDKSKNDTSEGEKSKDEPKDDADTDKRKLIDEVAGIMKSAGASDEEIRTAIGKMEKIGYDKSSAGSKDDADDDEDKDKDKDMKNKDDACGSDKQDAIEQMKKDLAETKAAMNEFKKVDKAKMDALATPINPQHEKEKRDVFETLFQASIKMDKANNEINVIPSIPQEGIVSYLSRVLLNNSHILLDEESKGIVGLIKNGCQLTDDQLPILRKVYQNMVSNLTKNDNKSVDEKTGVTVINHGDGRVEYRHELYRGV